VLRVSLKSLWARKFRLFATALAVVLGVAFMAGTLVLTDTVTRTFNNLFANVYKGTDAVVRGQSAFNGPQNTGAQRPRVDASLLPVVQQVPGVAAAEGSVVGYTRLVGANGKALGNPSMGPPTLGISWNAVPQLNPFTLVEGRAPSAPDEIVIDRKSAKDGHLTVGGFATVLTQAPPRQMRISGIVRFGNADSPAGATVVLFTLPVAQQLVAEPGKFDSIPAVADKGVSQAQLASRISHVLPAGTEAVTGAKLIKETQSNVRKGLSFFTTFMLVFAIIALIVGAFIIFNTFSITVAQKTRENALFRALGASRRQILRSVLFEAFVVGAVASVIGLAAGVAVAAGLKALLAAVGFAIPAGGVVFAVRTVIVCLVVGVGVTMLAAYSPARKAGKVPPVAAMRDVVVGSKGYGSKERVIIGSVVTGGGVVILFVGLFSHPSNALPIVGLGALLVFFGVSVLGRTVSLPLSRFIGYPLPRLRGVTGKIARQNAMRNPKRTAASASALMIGVGLVSFITIFASSTTASINATIDRSFTGDFVVDSGAGQGPGAVGGLDPSLAAQLNRLPEISAAAGIRMGAAKVDGSVQQLLGVDPATAFRLFDVKPLQGKTSDLGADSIAVYKNVASDKHLRIGSMLPVVFKDTGSKQLRVALIYGENRPAGNYLLGLPAYSANFANDYDNQVFVKKAPDASKPAALAAIKGVVNKYPGAKVLDQTGYKNELAKPVNQLLSLIYVLLALAIIIALLGIANTLALSIFERTRELGLLRAVGMTRSQLRSSIRWESVLIALQGTALGLLVGIFFGWSLVRALSNKGIDQLSIPPLQIIAIVVIAALAGVLAAVAPSRRAAKLDVLKAVVSD
jgi:putative ABC transport system permease protein